MCCIGGLQCTASYRKTGIWVDFVHASHACQTRFDYCLLLVVGERDVVAVVGALAWRPRPDVAGVAQRLVPHRVWLGDPSGVGDSEDGSGHARRRVSTSIGSEPTLHGANTGIGGRPAME